MQRNNLFILIYTIIILFSVMYATQPLQPLLANEFGTSMTHASYFTAVIMLFLGIAPIFYGYILEHICAKKLLINSSILLFFTNIALSLSTSYEMFLIIRTLEAAIVPAVLTSTMSILANLDKNNVQFNMSVYVASTIFGGLIGRVISGFIASEFGWRVVFFSLSLALLLGIVFLKRLSLESEANFSKAKLHDVFEILKDKRFILVYFLMFCMYFVFAGVLNILPFRMKEIMPDINESQIGLLYLGYGTGIVISLYIKRIISFIGSQLKTILVGILIFIFAVITLYVQNFIFTFFMLFLFCIGMFTVHSVCTTLANSFKSDKKSLTSGMYLTFYYLGGAFGSVIPMIIYEKFAWNVTLLLFSTLLLSVFLIIFFSRDTIK